MRSLYIVAGGHAPLNNDFLELYNVNSEMVRHYLQFSILEDIAVSEKCTGFFSDGQSQNIAETKEVYLENCFMELDSRLILEESKGIIQLLHTVEQQQCIYDLSEFFMIKQVREGGVPIKYLPTEADFDEKRPVEERDSIIFENIVKYGNEKNIFFIGYDHKLKDFNDKPHDFQICRINVPHYYRRAITIDGLPAHLKLLFNSYIQEGLTGQVILKSKAGTELLF